jgi:polar amino acid transport system permease protein
MGLRDFGFDEFWLLLLAARWTVLLSLAAFVGGGVLGFVVAVARIAPVAWLRGLAAGYIQLVQATPLLMVLMLLYFGLNLAGMMVDAWTAAVLGFTVSTSAFLAEIWRGCLALDFRLTLRLVILPQALRMALPPTVGYMVQVVKGTSVAALIGFVELARVGQQVNAITFQPVLVFGTVALMYFAMCWPLSLYSRHLEQKLKVGHVRVSAM